MKIEVRAWREGLLFYLFLCSATLMIVCMPTQPSGPPQVTLKELYDATVYNGWAPDSGSQYVAYDTVTIFDAIDGGAWKARILPTFRPDPVFTRNSRFP